MLALLLCCQILEAESSITIVVGKKASYDGSVMVAHNENLEGANFVNFHTSPPGRTQKKYLKLMSGEILRYPRKSNGFFWIQVPGRKNSESYFSHKGITLTENLTPSKAIRQSTSGIYFYLARLAVHSANSASDAVNMVGVLVEKYGYRQSGTTLCIADSQDAWIIHIIKGKYWVAKRVPDDQVAVVTDSFIIDKVDFKDSKNFRGSKDIIEYAIKRDWYDLEKEGFIGLLSLKDNLKKRKRKPGTQKAVLKQWQLKIIEGSFNFAKTYSSPSKNHLMKWYATQILSKKKIDRSTSLPFSFVPPNRIQLTTLFTILRSHYENSEFELTDSYKKGSPNLLNRGICNQNTVYSFVSWMRNSDTLPKDLKPVIWIASGQPDSNAYTPWYFTTQSIPAGYSTIDSRKALEKHFSKNILNAVPGACDDIAALNDKVNEDYRNRIRLVRKEWRNFENYLFKSLKKNEREYTYIFSKKPVIGLKLATCYIHNIALKKWFIATELLHKLSAP